MAVGSNLHVAFLRLIIFPPPDDIDDVIGDFHCLVVILLLSPNHRQNYLMHDFRFPVSRAAHPELVEQSADYHGFKQ
jgi:hypothetical protein